MGLAIFLLQTVYGIPVALGVVSCGIWQNREKNAKKTTYIDSRSFKVIEFVTNRKDMDFLSVVNSRVYLYTLVNSNLGRILHGLRTMVTYWSKSRLCNIFVLFNALARVIPWEYVDEPYKPKTRHTALSDRQWRRHHPTFILLDTNRNRSCDDRRTDRQTGLL